MQASKFREISKVAQMQQREAATTLSKSPTQLKCRLTKPLKVIPLLAPYSACLPSKSLRKSTIYRHDAAGTPDRLKLTRATHRRRLMICCDTKQEVTDHIPQ